MKDKNVRNSNIEMVRIISIFVIVLSHVVGGGKSLSGINKYLVILQNSTIHAGVGVTCFMFISGYYGIGFSRKRVNKNWSIVWTCSLCSLMFMFLAGNASLMDCLQSVIPIITKKYWYASCYIFLLILSPWINNFIDILEKKNFQKLILVCILLFYMLPTVFYFEIMDDKGKGLVHMIICYIIGRYIARYIDVPKIRISILWYSFCTIIGINFVGNIVATLIRGEISWPFSRECSITTLLIGILLCMIALHGTSRVKQINKVATYTFHTYLLNNALITFLNQYFVVNDHSIVYIFMQILIAIIICIVCVMIAVPLDIISGVVAKLINLMEDVFLQILKIIRKNLQEKLKNYHLLEK